MYLMLLTSLESKERVIAGLEAGADDYLIKPFDPEELRARVNVGALECEIEQRKNNRSQG